jgi:hypothetical protein
MVVEMKLHRLLMALVGIVLGATTLTAPAQAQIRQCLVTASSTPAVAEYDPFNPSGISVANVAITFTRANGPGGAKPSTIDMFIKSNNSAANGMQLIPLTVVGAGSATGLNQNIFYNTPGPTPNITVPLGGTPVPGVLRWDYSGNNAASDVFTVTFQVIVPANLDLTASSALNFNIEYGCNGTGGGPPFSERATAPNAFTLNINVLSALQASWVGADLDFGEVGDKTDVQVLGAPATYTKTGNIRVASSGPYQVTLASANDYRMTYPGGNVATTNQRLPYSLLFLGQVRATGVGGNINSTCDRASLAGRYLPIQVQLLEGGNLKVPAPVYRDTLTVTFQPQVVPSVITCGNTSP